MSETHEPYKKFEESIRLEFNYSEKEEHKMIVDLLKDSGWKVKYTITEKEDPKKTLRTQLIRKTPKTI